MRPRFLDTQNFLFGLFFETHRFAIQYTHTRFLKVNFLKKEMGVWGGAHTRTVRTFTFVNVDVNVTFIFVDVNVNVGFYRNLCFKKGVKTTDFRSSNWTDFLNGHFLNFSI